MQGFFFNDLLSSHLLLILKEIYHDRVYEPFVDGRSDMIIVDAGANIGLTVNYFSQFAKHVYAIEPCGAHRECLTAMVQQNGLDNVTIIPAGLSPFDGNARLYHNRNTTMHSFVAAESTDADYEETPVLTLATIMERYQIPHIDLLKMDVEGLEGEILESQAFGSVADRVRTIIGEWHDWGNVDKAGIEMVLSLYGYAGGWNEAAGSDIFFGTREQ